MRLCVITFTPHTFAHRTSMDRNPAAVRRGVPCRLPGPKTNDEAFPDAPYLPRVAFVRSAKHRYWLEGESTKLYRCRAADLEQLPGDPELGSEAMYLIRSMITDITVTPREDCDGVGLDLSGDLARILHLCSTGTMQHAQAVGAGRVGVSAYGVSVVAGRGFEPLTFRL